MEESSNKTRQKICDKSEEKLKLKQNPFKNRGGKNQNLRKNSHSASFSLRAEKLQKKNPGQVLALVWVLVVLIQTFYFFDIWDILQDL